MAKKQKQKKKKLIVDNDLTNSLQNSGFPGEIKNRAYMAPIQREILEYKKIKKKRKKARQNAKKKLEEKKEPKEPKKLVITPITQKEIAKPSIPKIPKISLFSRIKLAFKKKPKENNFEPIQVEQIQQPLSSIQVIKEIKQQETRPKPAPKENLFPDLQKLDHHKEEIEIIEHEPLENKKKDSFFSKVKSLFKSEKKEDDLYTLEPITAAPIKTRLKDIEDASSTHSEQKNDKKEQNEEKIEMDPEESSIGWLYSEKKKKKST